MPSLKRTPRRPLALSSSFIRALQAKFSFSSGRSDQPATTKRCTPSDSRTSTTRRKGHITPADVRSLRLRSRPALQQHGLIYLLPNELLSYIFYLGSLEDPMFVVTASRVCGLWREISLRTPTLWRNVYLDCRAGMWHSRILRAKGCSLDVHLHSPHGYRHNTHRWNHFTVQWVMQPALPHVHRWRTLDIHLDTYAPFLWNAALSPVCRESPHVAAPLLQELSLVYRLNDDSKHFDLFNGIAPRLRRVTLHGIRLVWTPSMFESITYLDYTHHGFTRGNDAVAELLAMLGISTRLECLTITFPPPRHDRRRVLTMASGHTRTAVTLLRLHTLRISVTERCVPMELVQLLAHFSAPRLGTLVLDDTSKLARPLASLDALAGALHVGLASASRLCLGHGFLERYFVLSLVRTWSRLRRIDVIHPTRGRFDVALPPDMRYRDRKYLHHFGRAWL